MRVFSYTKNSNKPAILEIHYSGAAILTLVSLSILSSK